jgi:TPP-dependent trihydroxycyclohexane-1,2-dione (THcHDO) dehydratase
MGMYVSAIAVSQDNSLRKAIKKSIPELFDNVGSAQTEKELLARAVRLLKANREEMEVETGGVSYALTEDDIKEYIVQVIREKKRSK